MTLARPSGTRLGAHAYPGLPSWANVGTALRACGVGTTAMTTARRDAGLCLERKIHHRGTETRSRIVSKTSVPPCLRGEIIRLLADVLVPQIGVLGDEAS